jgi:hypothetical protein
MKRRIAYGLVLIASLTIAVAPALAGKGGGGGGTTSAATGSLVPNNPSPHFGDTISFTATFGALRSSPEVRVLCSQNGQSVYSSAQFGDGSSPWSPSFTLSGGNWLGGSASCFADLYYYTWQGKTETGVVYLAHVDFEVAA